MTSGSHDPTASDDALARIQDAVGIVARRAKDLRLHETLGDRVGYRLEGSHYGTLARLALARRCSITELADMLGLEISTVSRRVKDLEAKGLVARRSSPVDLRSSLVELTPEGEALFGELSAQWRGMLAEVLDGWSPTEVDRFAATFERFAAALDRYAGGSNDRPASGRGPTDRIPAG